MWYTGEKLGLYVFTREKATNGVWSYRTSTTATISRLAMTSAVVFIISPLVFSDQSILGPKARDGWRQCEVFGPLVPRRMGKRVLNNRR